MNSMEEVWGNYGPSPLCFQPNMKMFIFLGYMSHQWGQRYIFYNIKGTFISLVKISDSLIFGSTDHIWGRSLNLKPYSIIHSSRENFLVFWIFLYLDVYGDQKSEHSSQKWLFANKKNFHTAKQIIKINFLIKPFLSLNN